MSKNKSSTEMSLPFLDFQQFVCAIVQKHNPDVDEIIHCILRLLYGLKWKQIY